MTCRVSLILLCAAFLGIPCETVQMPLEEQFKHTELVFDGVATDVRQIALAMHGSVRISEETLITVTATRSWKGSVGPVVQLH